MRHIGHKIPSHGVSLLQRSHIARQKQPTAISVSMQLHRQAYGVQSVVFTPGHDNTATVIASRNVSGERRIAHQVHQMLLLITLRVQTKMRSRRLIAPLNLPLGIEQDNPIG